MASWHLLVYVTSLATVSIVALCAFSIKTEFLSICVAQSCLVSHLLQHEYVGKIILEQYLMFIFSSNTFCNSVQKDRQSQQDKEHFGIRYLTLLDMFINNIYSVSGNV